MGTLTVQGASQARYAHGQRDSRTLTPTTSPNRPCHEYNHRPPAVPPNGAQQTREDVVRRTHKAKSCGSHNRITSPAAATAPVPRGPLQPLQGFGQIFIEKSADRPSDSRASAPATAPQPRRPSRLTQEFRQPLGGSAQASSSRANACTASTTSHSRRATPAEYFEHGYDQEAAPQPAQPSVTWISVKDDTKGKNASRAQDVATLPASRGSSRLARGFRPILGADSSVFKSRECRKCTSDCAGIARILADAIGLQVSRIRVRYVRQCVRGRALAQRRTTSASMLTTAPIFGDSDGRQGRHRVPAHAFTTPATVRLADANRPNISRKKAQAYKT
ncbi:hypothetical protein EDB87DRAFT_1681283 [Lactarius vividus]|nr:hypothetical protein EDB87DRAFT_1681283 [Lactarius vividus]